jgi:MEMO1 family protein
MTSVRPAAVAGTFYPGTAKELGETVIGLLNNSGTDLDMPVPKAIVAPHAGYVYSGSMAAKAYARLIPARGQISRVVLLGPCHRVAIRGLALSSAEVFTTPLGNVRIDKDACEAIEALPQVDIIDATHKDEHSLEVHLPFLQQVLGDFLLVPLVVGDCGNEHIAEVLDMLWGGPETLIVISTDLTHFLDYDTARQIDARTCEAIENMETGAIEREQACGRIPLKGFLTLAKRRGMNVETLGVNNSGDTAGSKDRVVGYGSWAIHEGDS